jgi:ABC-type multidrug transport system ATPase subunit
MHLKNGAPNGAGKSTTMRMIAGLDRPTSGTVRVNGKHYPEAAAPMGELGILLDARSVHPGLSARNNLLALARTAGIGRRRVDEVIELAGLGEVAGTRAGGFSLGMGQRLGVAAALLGQPQTVVLDEPVNGLDPDGVRWIRLLLRSLAAEGRTVFVSPHLMSEMAQTASVLVAGLYVSTRRAYLAELRDRAQRLEREHDQTSALAAAMERARIAREMHDSVAHHLTVIVALSDGALAAATRAPAQAPALDNRLRCLSTASG